MLLLFASEALGSALCAVALVSASKKPVAASTT
jgi:hypothetical protein